MFQLLGRQTYRVRWLWIAAGCIVLFVGILYGVNVFAGLKDVGVEDPASESAVESSQMLRDFPRSRVSFLLLASSPTLLATQPQFANEFQRIVAAVKTDPAKPSVESYYSSGSSTLLSRDRHATFAVIGVPGSQSDLLTRIKPLIRSSVIRVQLGGPAVADHEINDEVARDLPQLGMISLPLLGILLLLVFRSVIAAVLPLVIGAISVLGAFAITRFLSSFIDISVFAANIISLLGLGLAIDYSLLYISRFRDELADGKSVEAAITISSGTAGAAIFLSGTTVALSLLGILVFPEMFLRSMGLGGALAVTVAVISSLTVLPAILSVLGPKIDALMIPLPINRRGVDINSGWRALGQFVVRRPVAVLVVSLGVLIAAGIPFIHVRFADPGLDSLPASFQSRQVSDQIARDFPASDNPAIEVILTMPKSPINEDQLQNLFDYSDQLEALHGVKSVDGLSDVSSALSASDASDVFYSEPDPRVRELKDRYLSGNSTLLTVNYSGGVSDASTQSLVKEIRAMQAPAGTRVLVGGDTADLVDRLQSLKSHLPLAMTLIFTATFVVLTAMLSSLIIPIKAIVLNTLSLGAAFGLMTWIFQDGHLQRALDFTSSGSLDPTLPVLIFAIAFGLATDYEVFLVSRIKEEYERTGSNSAAIVIGVEKTGGIITSAGLLLVVVVAAFGLSHILSMKEMGVGLAVAVAVDAAIVRTLLVPAALKLFDRLNWWMPGRRKPSLISKRLL